MEPNVFETANAGFAQALYEDYLRDPASVAPEWRRLFESGVAGERPSASNGAAAPAPTVTPAAASAAVPPGATELKGPAARLVQNMNESLRTPTATTFRELNVTLLDIKDPAHPFRLDAVSDSNFSYWHSATFNNDGTKVLFSDEWGGGGAPKCRASDPKDWGADAIFTLADDKMHFQSYYKMPAPQTEQENCVAHNGSLIPIPGRDVMVQSWYQGGISVFDWTDAQHPKEIAFFDRGPVDSTRMGNGGTWSAYWFNGVIVSSEIGRGLDVLALQPSGLVSQNELDAAKTVRFEYFNTQDQPKFVWPASFALSGAYLDQLQRSNGLTGSQISATRNALAAAQAASGSRRSAALTALAASVAMDVSGSSDAGKVKTLAASIRSLAAAQ